MPLLKTPAITLRSRRWGEADRIVTFYTLRFGKLRGVARGARRLKSRFGSALEPFVHCDLNLFEKANDHLHRVTQADIQESFAGLREDLERMASAARLANLVNAITAEGDQSSRKFETLLAGLRALQAGHDPGLTALLFQVKLLELSGYQPRTDHCVACGGELHKTGEAKGLRFSPVAGGLVCDSCAWRRPDGGLVLSPGSVAFLQKAGQLTPEALTRLTVAGPMRRELDTTIEAYVTVVAGKRLPPVDFLAAEPREPAYEVKQWP